jgi:Tol biopolymer transport system component
MQVELPRWSPDGKWIAFTGHRGRAGLWQVFVIPAEGGEYRPVLTSQTPQGAPTWSQDGAKLAFGELIGAGRPARELVIHLVNLKTHQDTTLPGSTGLWTARWSPNGRYVAALTADSRALVLYDFRTEKWIKLASAGSISDLNWTRQSEAIYFEDSLPPGGPGIFRLRLRNRRLERVASLRREPPIISSWLGLAPDGSVMVSNTVGSSEIYALDWEAP